MKRRQPSIQELKEAYTAALLARQPRLYEAVWLSRAILLREAGLPLESAPSALPSPRIKRLFKGELSLDCGEVGGMITGATQPRLDCGEVGGMITGATQPRLDCGEVGGVKS